MSLPKVKLLSPEESSSLVGVNVSTIKQYRDLGLLRVKNIEGQDYFEEEDLRLIFNSKIREMAFSPVRHKTEASSEEDLPTLSSILNQKGEKEVEDTVKAEQLGAKVKALDGELEKSNVIKFKADFSEDERPSSIDILELTRSLKQQLELVISERNWLRQRVEKLEMQFERQQIISISESETLRMLAKAKEEKKSTWAFLLPWFQSKD